MLPSQNTEDSDEPRANQNSPRPSQSSSEASSLQDEQRIRTHLKSLIEATATLSSEGITGSAFFIQSDGYLITNDHVTNKMSSIKVQTSDGKVRPGKVLRTEAQYDLALVKVDGGPYPTLALGDATKLEQGETVWTIGAPHGLSFTVTRGIVSFVGRRLNGRGFIQADVAINPGNSGGPMINSQGEVIGINNFIISNAVGLNFAIPINYIYMGPKPIAQTTIPTQPDNEIMAEWRSWEVPNQAQVANWQENPSQRNSQPNFPSASPRVSDAEGILAQMNRLDDEFTAKKNRADSAISRLKADRDRLQKNYDAADMNISSETEFGKRISTFTKDILRQELGFIEDTISYCNSMEPLVQQAANAVDPSRRASVEAKGLSVRQMRTEALSLKEAKNSELRTESEKVY